MRMFKGCVHEPDFIDRNLASSRIACRDNISGLRVGDYLYIDGEYCRVASNYPSVQVESGGGYYHLYNGGYVSFSGGLKPHIEFKELVLLPETKPGMFWIEHHGILEYHCSVYIETECRVFEVKND